MRYNPRDELLDLHRRHVRAWENRNISELRDIFDAKALIFGPEPPARFNDYQSFENTLAHYFAGMEDVFFSTSNIAIELNEPVAWVTSFYLSTFRRNGEESRETGRWTEIYLRTDAGWKLVHFHASKDPGAA
ncbi:MAG: hypothetical protein Kow00109_26810 [Acidobacteriota bacterium]